ncbi:unnamed protein product [Periconia digitata]|uniref:Zn(2)-C6 fungal-type domain-containing protein n=1 Tax=Periconia digitata TaxID=1303443 RepID=A0A9W4UVB6_9PLEO|nr:unnamed protein product [Periconia digitata]
MTSENKKSALTQGLMARESWTDYINWNDEYDPVFEGANASTHHHQEYGSQYSNPANYSSDRHDLLLANQGLLSDYEFVSAPSSTAEGTSPLGQDSSWPSTTTGTSPFMDRAMAYPSSINVCEDLLSPSHVSAISPLFGSDSFTSPNSYPTTARPLPFNPYLATSPNAFNNLDISASQALSNLGSWVEQSPLPQSNHGEFSSRVGINEIPEIVCEGTMPISIPFSQKSSPTFPSQQWTATPTEPQEQQQQQLPTPSQPINISQSRFQRQQVPPLLPVSPDHRSLPRSASLSSSISKHERRRSRTSISQSRNEYAWVNYEPQSETNSLVPSVNGIQGRRNRGRVGPLRVDQRSHAALMRRVASCSSCRKRKEKCDPGIPCRSCIEYYKGDLINHPCRDFRISDLSNDFLAERLGWHPIERSISSFVGPHGYHEATDLTYRIPLTFGFGPALMLSVHPVQIADMPRLRHNHLIYSWPPNTTAPIQHTHAVLPAVITAQAKLSLQNDLDKHLALLVKQHFREFPLFCSPLNILREVYILYRTLPTMSAYARLLEQSLKLLVLVHIGGDVTLPTSSTHPDLQDLMNATMQQNSEQLTTTPCFIRSQFGAVMPSLALCIMKEVLLSLEQLLVHRDPKEWPIALATLIVVLITVESIQYHAAKLPYHYSYDSLTSRSQLESESRVDDEGAVKSLLGFYAVCFSSCHTKLHERWDAGRTMGDAGHGATPGDKFIESVREAIRKAASEDDYLVRKAGAQRAGDDMRYFFDRLAARLLVLNP